MRKIIISPYVLEENDFLRLLIEAIEHAGYQPVAQHGNRTSSDAILYNWYENMDDAGFVVFVKKLLMIAFYKMTGTKIIWVVHNKQPHINPNQYSRLLMKYLALMSNRIMVLCDEGMNTVASLVKGQRVQNKISKVPIVNYTSIVGDVSTKNRTEKMNLLMFGRIQPYKCIEVLIKAVNASKYKDQINVLITGNANNQSYVRLIEKLIEDNNQIELKAKFVSLDDLREITRKTDAFVLPMNIKSSMNSSAVMMAFSLGRTVICPAIGTTNEYSDINEFAYCYNYSTEEEHFHALKQAIENAYEDYISQPEGLSRQGKIALDRVVENNSIHCVAEKFREMMEQIPK